MTERSGPTVTAGRFREVMRAYPTGVVGVTAATDRGPRALLVGSFLSISLRPALVGFCVGEQSTTWPDIRQAARFGIGILAADQQDLGRTLAAPGPQRLAGVPWRPSSAGVPVLPGVLAHLECVPVVEHPAGDHTLVVAEIRSAESLRDHQPLIFFHRTFGTVTDARSGDRQVRSG
ncbi:MULTISPECIES: flavin reductase family protein [unclassified Solwaraspora]|uniref:flavin reductase family protein n=1 Tax=unclassified Solwaraspora TaxID=2627926 RepID=UPI00248D039E|nr:MULTISPECIES: flavin reductase family protein [unclassified Solwaraspora]WBB99828.1 flavin reductase family protein [Solwaraspora sp. WMMA2059]WBC21624.1 flavin reductase family protein [Solwaraspora sp. WMMA2080]WJK36317.1 flavin reductase family protein [Solwaraspora sp. WMMA2065]